MVKKFQRTKEAHSPPARDPQSNGDTPPSSFPSGWDPLSALTEAPVGLLMTDPERNLLWWNQRAEEILELNQKPAHGEALHQVLGVPEFALPIPEDPSSSKTSTIPQFELAITTPSGKNLTLQISQAQISPGHPPSGKKSPLQWAFTDVSWRKEIEAQINNYASHVEMAFIENEAAKQHAEAENQAKSSFLANMSHEIRTPMTAILGFAETLQDSGLCAEEVNHAIDTIQRNGSYLLGIINDILDLSKIDAEQMTLEKREIDLRELFFDVRDLLEARAKGKGIHFRLEAPDGLPARIQSDPIRLRQVLINLVGNAIKFTHEGEVVLMARKAPQDRGLIIEVTDSGIGLTPAQSQRIFEPFSQGDASTTREYGGTGLGLAICKRLCDALGGELSVSSTEGIGSTFSFSLPLSQKETDPNDAWLPLDAPVQKTRRKKPGRAPQLKGKILLAEDGPDNLRLISYLLRKTGVEVQTAENGREALEKALRAWEEKQPFDLILMDLQMPEMDGFEATQCLRDKGYQGPILALTAHGMGEILDQATQAGCNGWITKPIDRQKFFQSLSSVLQPQ
jgi:signal transduction histidine kinase/CheY-like chemotaxis protein